MGQRYVSAWDAGVRNLGGHWIKQGSRSKGDTLDSLMQTDHVIRVVGDGLVHDDVRDVYVPEIDMATDDDGQILKEHEDAFKASMECQGWTVEFGWSGQNSGKYNGPVMHVSEFIGGSLAEHILTTPGYWVACAVIVDSEECPNESPTCKLSDPCARRSRRTASEAGDRGEPCAPIRGADMGQ
jgi:hypothetical protein